MLQAEKNHIISLFPYIEKINDIDMRNKVIQTWHNAWKCGNFHRIEDVHQLEPARDLIVYSNVDHTNQVCRVAEEMSIALSRSLGLRVEMDQLLAGAILHDVDKIVLFDSRTGGYTDMGRRFVHAMMGATMALTQGLPHEVAHMIMAHSFKLSSIAPASIEALILRQADELIAHAVYLANGLNLDLVITQSFSRIA